MKTYDTEGLAEKLGGTPSDIDVFAELAEMYRPQGSCATGCGHEATEMWFLQRGSNRFEFRCACCMAKGRLERALDYQKRIPKLERELAEAVANCGLISGR